jgi:hypothetical protein
MAYDTKVLLSALAQNIAKSETVEEAYFAVVESANVEGVQIPTYDEAMKKLTALRNKSKKG